MTRLGGEALVLAALLALTAGFVDAVGFLQLGGFFLSFMSGNTTRLGVGAGGGDWGLAGQAAGLIGLFLAGVVAGGLAPEGMRYRQPILLAAVAGLLILAAGSTAVTAWFAAGLAAVAMGALNVVFQRDGDIAFGVTYMTGGLARMGIRIAAALKGGPRWAFAPFLLLWLAMAGGAVIGCLAQGAMGGRAFWLASAACAGMGGLAYFSARRASAAPD
jgi:uncharacterized membrane protein YoaK (UPF0700 family)